MAPWENTQAVSLMLSGAGGALLRLDTPVSAPLCILQLRAVLCALTPASQLVRSGSLFRGH